MTSYIARKADETGFIQYSEEENQTWAFLYERQMGVIKDRACNEYIQGLATLGLTAEKIPQLNEVSDALKNATGWEVAAVPALIPFGTFFELLSNKKFPAATFIRSKDEIDYLQEPDIFHEIYGHCPMLTHPVFADFCHNYGKLGLSASKQERVYLARLFWFTVEFGLIKTEQGPRIYGAGILSSKGETIYALEDKSVEIRPFDLMTILRTPYRIDIYQPIYYMIENFEQLYSVMNESLLDAISQAIELGDFEPTFEPKPRTVGDKHDC